MSGTTPWVRAERNAGRPVAAPLAACAELLGVPEADLAPVAAQVEPYRHADGHPVWSLYLLEKVLHPDRFQKSKGGGVATRRHRSQVG